MYDAALYQKVSRDWGANTPGFPIRDLLCRWLVEARAFSAPAYRVTTTQAEMKYGQFVHLVHSFAYDLSCLASTSSLLGTLREQLVENDDNNFVLSVARMIQLTERLTKRLHQRLDREDPLDFEVLNVEGTENEDGFVVVESDFNSSA